MELLALIISFLGGLLITYIKRRRKDEFERQPQDAADLPDDRDTTVLNSQIKWNDPAIDNPHEYEGEEEEDFKVAEVEQGAKQRFLWLLNAGHGKLTPGKRSPVSPHTGERLFEYEINRDILRLIKIDLDVMDINYVDVVPEVEVGNFLRERVERANNFPSSIPKFYLSIHHNAGPAPDLDTFTHPTARGVEVWYYHASEKGRKAARIFQRHLVEQTGLRDRGIKSKKAGEFYELKATKMVANVGEGGFYNNAEELEKLQDPAFRKSIARAYVLGILEIEENGL